MGAGLPSNNLEADMPQHKYTQKQIDHVERRIRDALKSLSQSPPNFDPDLVQLAVRQLCRKNVIDQLPRKGD